MTAACIARAHTHKHTHTHTHTHTNTHTHTLQTLDGGRRNMYDPDEIEEEQRERDRRNKTNAEFNAFVKRVQVGVNCG